MTDRQIAEIFGRINAALRRCRPRLTLEESAELMFEAAEQLTVIAHGKRGAARIFYLSAVALGKQADDEDLAALSTKH